MQTEISATQEIIGDEYLEEAKLKIAGLEEMLLSFVYPTDGSPMKVTITHPENSEKTITVRPGDTVNLRHKFNFNVTHEVKENHVFPLTLDYGNRVYTLSNTKNHKLHLT